MDYVMHQSCSALLSQISAYREKHSCTNKPNVTRYDYCLNLAIKVILDNLPITTSS